MDHKINLEHYEDLKKLAEDIGNLRYDSLKEFLGYLEDKLFVDSLNDRSAGRTKLANNLEAASIHIGAAQDSINYAWKISKPFMDIEE